VIIFQKALRTSSLLSLNIFFVSCVPVLRALLCAGVIDTNVVRKKDFERVIWEPRSR